MGPKTIHSTLEVNVKDTWKRDTEFGVITYTTRGEVNVGFVHTAKFESKDLATVFSHKTAKQPTRAEIELLFVDDFPPLG
jgi:hypothetical protein